jgi:hypothetical protein
MICWSVLCTSLHYITLNIEIWDISNHQPHLKHEVQRTDRQIVQHILTTSRNHTRRLPCLLIRTVTLSLQIDTSSVQPTNTHDTPRFIKPARRYFPPHHTTSSSHQPNLLQHREKTPPPPPATRHAQVITATFIPPFTPSPDPTEQLTYKPTTFTIPLCVTIYYTVFYLT